MKKLLCIITVCLFFFMSTQAEAKWDPKDRNLLIVYGILTVLDGTITAAARDNTLELNPLFQDKYGRADMKKMWMAKGVGFLFIAGASHYDKKRRRSYLWVVVLTQGAVVGWNLQF